MFKKLETEPDEMLLMLLSDVVEEGSGFGCTSPACNSKHINQERQVIVTKP